MRFFSAFLVFFLVFSVSSISCRPCPHFVPSQFGAFEFPAAAPTSIIRAAGDYQNRPYAEITDVKRFPYQPQSFVQSRADKGYPVTTRVDYTSRCAKSQGRGLKDLKEGCIVSFYDESWSSDCQCNHRACWEKPRRAPKVVRTAAPQAGPHWTRHPRYEHVRGEAIENEQFAGTSPEASQPEVNEPKTEIGQDSDSSSLSFSSSRPLLNRLKVEIVAE